MASNTLDRSQTRQGELETQVDRLAQFIEEHFPAEAAGADMCDRKDVLRLATDLLDRLWRWEH